MEKLVVLECLQEKLRAKASEISSRLKSFDQDARLFSSETACLIDSHENNWVGVFEGGIKATAETLESLENKMKDLGIPLNQAMIRRVDREPKTLIL